MGGIELYNRIVSKDKSLVEKVIFITGDTVESSTRAFLSIEEVSYITKPFDENLLKEEIRCILNEMK
jgi:DNA-binding response OmpR family regulator